MSDNDLLNIFRLEVAEYLQALNSALLQVEIVASTDPVYKAMMVEMNRVAHSMKGAARAVGIGVIETVAHYMEEVFNAAMNQTLKLSPETCDVLYDSLDLIQTVMDGAEYGEEDLANVLTQLERIVTGATVTDSQHVAVVPAVELEEDDEDVAIFLEDDDELSQIIQQKATSPQPPKPIPNEERPTQTVERPAFTTTTTTFANVADMQTLSMRPAEETIRVPVSKLDRLMAEATELLVARMHGEERLRAVNELRKTHTRWQREWRNVRAAYIRLVRRMQDRHEEVGSELQTLFKFLESNQRYLSESNRRLAQLAQASAQDNMHLSTLTDQLQDDIGGMRLVPFDSIVGGFQRMVRDLARDTEKQVQLDIIGAFVEIDKTVLEALKDPLMHLLRNAIDHGIETPSERDRMNKSPVGRITIHVEQRGSEIVLRVSDDGRGINPQNVRRAIVKNHLLSEAEAALLGDDEVRLYIFHPGLSTNDTVTALSGRGFGMDIVRDRVESLRGRITVHSEMGVGTTMTINVPVSLTRIRCIMLRVGDQQFAIPSVVVKRMDTLPRESIFTAEGQDMVVVNDQPVPAVSLGAILDIPSSSNLNDFVQLLVLEAANRIIAFEVDLLQSEHELVLKPLGPELARSRYISGAALLGTGDIVIVLDANNLVRAASGTVVPRRAAPVAVAAPTQRRMRVLVADDSITTRTLEKNILETVGFEVHVAIDGMEAWSTLMEMEFDLVISDVEMPNMTGLELTARIKQSAQHRHIPVILLTSLSKPEQREAGLRAGADAYLVKSRFDQNELLQTIQSVI